MNVGDEYAVELVGGRIIRVRVVQPGRYLTSVEVLDADGNVDERRRLSTPAIEASPPWR
jgi:hypothetical protein